MGRPVFCARLSKNGCSLFFWMSPVASGWPITLSLILSCANVGAATSEKPSAAMASFVFMLDPRGCGWKSGRSGRDCGSIVRLLLGCCGRLREIRERRLNAARTIGDAGRREPHFDAGQRAGERQVVQVAQMPDPEYATLELREPGTERQVEAIENQVAQPITVMAFGHHDRGERVAVFGRFGTQDVEVPGAHGAPRRFGVPRVTRKDVFEALLVQHVDRGVEPVQ